MKNDVQVSVCFCEDYRVEEGGKPIVIGLLAPVGYVDWDEQTDNRLYLLCTITAPPEMREVNLKLVLRISPNSGERSTKRFGTTLQFEDAFEVGEPWTSWVPLPVEVPKDPLGVRFRAELTVNESFAWASFVVKPSSDGTESASE
jgi:hypothetical protein